MTGTSGKLYINGVLCGPVTCTFTMTESNKARFRRLAIEKLDAFLATMDENAQMNVALHEPEEFGPDKRGICYGYRKTGNVCLDIIGRPSAK